MTLTAAQVADTLRAAGHAESAASRNVGISVETTGFCAVQSGLRVIVVPVIGDDMEGHPESPAHAQIMERMAAGYREALEAAGFHAARSEQATALIVAESSR